MYFVLNLHVFQLKLSNIEITKTLLKRFFSLTLIKKIYSIFTKVFRLVLDKHASLKVKKVRGNQGPLMTKELGKAIMNTFKIRNKYQRWPSREHFLALKKAKKLYNKLCQLKKHTSVK